MATALIRLPEVRRLTGLSRSEIYRRMTLGQFPAKVSIGPRIVGWPEDEIAQWVDACIKRSRLAAA
ncbi:MAG TPA: AlpA family transcriptional regulator [Gammaproteobacteria bacterium]|jgi:prophage regulatory protein|nr:AlpA family transcriptional regulator [Gammaproteobacteria bacterium]